MNQYIPLPDSPALMTQAAQVAREAQAVREAIAAAQTSGDTARVGALRVKLSVLTERYADELSYERALRQARAAREDRERQAREARIASLRADRSWLDI